MEAERRYRPGAPGPIRPATYRELERVGQMGDGFNEWIERHLDAAQEPDPHPQYARQNHFATLYGEASSGTVGTGFTKLTNYTQGAAFAAPGRADPPSVDLAAGEVTIAANVGQRLTFYLLAEQGNNAKEEQLELWLNASGQARIPLGVFDIATDKTSVRYIAGTVSRAVVPDTYWLELSATSGLGNFGTVRATFEWEQLG